MGGLAAATIALLLPRSSVTSALAYGEKQCGVGKPSLPLNTNANKPINPIPIDKPARTGKVVLLPLVSLNHAIY
jgi:hypothetical protein